MSAPTPEGVIGVELEGKGFQEVFSWLQQHETEWDKIATSAGRMSDYLGRAAGHIGALAGVAGVGAIVADFSRVEDITARIALNVGYIRGDGSGHHAISAGVFGAGRATSTDPTQMAAALGGLSSVLPSNGVLNGEAATKLFGTRLGLFGQGYGVDVATLANQAGPAALFMGQGMNSIPGMLGLLANQAARSGMQGQTGLFWQSVLGLTAGLGSAHPGSQNPALSRQLGAMYGATASVNQAFRDPSTFANGVAGVDQAIAGAYRNPRLEAAMQMAGISYRDQRYGLAGPHGQQTATKLLRFSEQMYGKGTTEQDLFLRSNFGDVSADMLEALSKGKKTYQQLLKETPAGSLDEAHKRYAEPYHTPNALRNRTRNALDHAAGGPLGGILNALSSLSPAELVALGIGGPKALGLLGRGGKTALNFLRARGAQAGAEAAAAAATGEGAAEGTGGLLAALGLGAAGSIAGGVAGAYAGFMLFPDSAGLPPGLENGLIHGREGKWLQGLLKHTTSEAQRRFGKNWMSDPRAQRWAMQRLHHPQASPFGIGLDNQAKAIAQGGQLLQGLFNSYGAARGGVAAGGHDPVTTFDEAVKRFERTVKGLDSPHAGSQGASYMGGARMLNAAGMLGGNDALGSSMILARYITAAGGGAGGGTAGTQFASMVTPTGGGGGGAGGGGGWSSCTLTWYDPALGGTNSSSGRKDPHSKMANGAPYQASAMTCAAPPAYAFGTQISFRYAGTTVTCTVTDRGGAITGEHFDLSRAAASQLGVIAAGVVQGEFKVLGGAAGNARAKKHAPGADGGHATSPISVHAQAARWMSTPAGAGGGAGGAGGDGAVHVHIDGARLATYKRRTRGRA